MSSLPNGSLPKGFHMADRLFVESKVLAGRLVKSSKSKSDLSRPALPKMGDEGGVLYAAETVRPDIERCFWLGDLFFFPLGTRRTLTSAGTGEGDCGGVATPSNAGEVRRKNVSSASMLSSSSCSGS